MNKDDPLSRYIDTDDETTAPPGEVSPNQTEQSQENMTIDSTEETSTIGPKYVEGSSTTEAKGAKQYGLAKPKKTILKAQLKND